MITTWVLVITIYFDRSISVTTIQNLRDLNECRRIEQVMKNMDEYGRRYYKCIETINK